MAHILICEDDTHLLDLLDLTLTLDGHDVETVTTGTDALHRLKEPAVDLVVLDIMLPGTDGLEILTQLRRTPHWRDAHVIILSALDSDHDIWQGWTRGTDYYLTKPFDPGHLSKIVRSLLITGEIAT